MQSASFCFSSARTDCLAQLIPLRPLSHMYSHDSWFSLLEDLGDARWAFGNSICTVFLLRD